MRQRRPFNQQRPKERNTLAKEFALPLAAWQYTAWQCSALNEDGKHIACGA
jgi:hypothetical protein